MFSPTILTPSESSNTLEILNKYHIRYVLFPQDNSVAYLLMNNPGWKTSYQDGTTVMLERVGAVP